MHSHLASNLAHDLACNVSRDTTCDAACTAHNATHDTTLQQILAFATSHKDIALVTLEGSRANKNAKRDRFQDYDISFFMPNITPLREDSTWLGRFGEVLMVQMPESMELFVPDLKAGWFSYLAIYASGLKIDFTLIPLSDVEFYFTNERLTQVLLDKEKIVAKRGIDTIVITIDRDFWLKPLTQRSFEDCLNEFYHLKGYALRSFLRREVLAYNAYVDSMRECVLILLAWQRALSAIESTSGVIESKQDSLHTFNFSYGKHYKYLPKSLPKKTYKLLLQTYALGNLKQSKKALKALQILCDKASKKIAQTTGFAIPPYKRALKAYTKALRGIQKHRI